MRGQFIPEQSFARSADPAFRNFARGSRFVAVQPEADGAGNTVSGTDRKAPAPTAAQDDVTEQQQGTFGRSFGVELASVELSYRLLPESLPAPDVVLNMGVKIPTGRHPFGIEFVEVEGSEGNLSIPEQLSYGTGVYGASVGVSVLKTLALVANVGMGLTDDSPDMAISIRIPYRF